MRKIFLTAALTGGVPTKTQNKNLPVTPEEIIAAAILCFEEGATIFHIHVRDPQTEAHTIRRELFEEVQAGIQKYCPGASLCFTTSGRGTLEKDRGVHLSLRPELATYCPADVILPGGGYKNSDNFLREQARAMKTYGVKPEIEIFTKEIYDGMKKYCGCGVIAQPPYVQFITGITGYSLSTDVAVLKPIVEETRALFPGSRMSIAGVGKYQVEAIRMGIELGLDGIRVGMEDNIYKERGVLTSGNFELVRMAREMCEAAGVGITTSEETRNMLGL